MIKANELRIGNDVYYNGKHISISPEGLRELFYLSNTHTKSLTDKREYTPIRLTTEILEKCGFLKDETEGWISDIYELDLGRKAFRIQLSTESMILRFDAGCNWSSATESPEYVHQLQNLYFALTGEELIFSELSEN